MDDIPTSNKFDALTEEASNYSTSDDEAEMQQNRSTDLQPPTKKKKISPIVVTNSGLSSETKAKIHLNIIKNHTGKNFDVGIVKLVWYNEQLIFALILNARISHMNCLHK